MKIVPVVGETYYGNWRHYPRGFQWCVNGVTVDYNEQRDTYTVKRALTITPCHSCPCHCAVMNYHGEFDCWGCSLGAEVVEMPTRMSDERSYFKGSIRPDFSVVGSENCPLISIQHKNGTYLKPTATVTVYEIDDEAENRLVAEVTE